MKTLLNVKIDTKVKKEARRLAEELGMPLSVIVNAYLRQFVRNKGVYFSIIPQMSKKLENILGRVEKDLRAGRNISQPFASSQEMDRHLDSL